MCEIRFYRCPCGERWTAHKKLSSCESAESTTRCPDNLCMYVGSVRKSQKDECEACKELREAFEVLEAASDEEREGKAAEGAT